MKVLFITLLVVASALGRNVHIVRSNGVKACPIADPLIVEEGGVLNVTLNPLLTIDEGSTRGSLVALGLSTLVADVNINALLLTATFDITVETVDIKTTYEASGYLDFRPLRQVTIPSGNFTGAGDASITATTLELRGSATLFINLIGNKVSVRILNILALTFDEITVDLDESFVIGGSAVNWADWNTSFKSNFQTDFRGSIKTDLVEKIRTAANVIVGQYTLAELIDLIGGGGDEEPCETN